MSLALLIAFQIIIINCHKCGTDLLKIVPGKISTLNVTNIKRKAESINLYKDLKIKVDMTQIKLQNVFDNENLKKLEDIFNEVVDSFSKILSVQHYLIIDDYSQKFKDYCAIESLEESSKTGFKDNDLLIFPYVEVNNEILNENVLAAATPCLISEETYRPMAGVVLINKNLVREISQKKDYKYYMKNLLFHELTHVLGFHPIYLDGLKLTYSERIDGIEYTYVKSKKVLEKAKMHFGCDTIQGLQLENQGGEGSSGSHWEARYMLGDYMISSDYTEVVMSDITLALLEDTGFYKAKYYTGGLFRFGKNQGCSFLEKKCLYDQGRQTLFPNEFCVNSKPFCSTSHIAKGDCFITKYQNQLSDLYRYFEDRTIGGLPSSDYCPVSYIFQSDQDSNYYYPKNCKYGKKENDDDIIGSNSLCFESSIYLSEKESVCYEIICDKTKKSFDVQIRNTVVNCPGEDTVLTNPNNLKGEFHCPDYNMVCTSDIWCNDIFDCIDKSSEADNTTYYYISNKKALLAKDRENSLIEDSKFDNSNFLNKKIKSILCYLFLFL